MARQLVFSLMTLPLLVACPESDDRPMVADAGPDRRDQICREGQFQCAGDSACIPEEWVCDGHEDCVNGDDEPADCVPPVADAGPGADAGAGDDAGAEPDAGSGAGDGNDAGAGGGDDAGAGGGDDAGAGGGDDAGAGGGDDAGVGGGDDAGVGGGDDAGVGGGDDAGVGGGDDAGVGGGDDAGVVDDHGDAIDDATPVPPEDVVGGQDGAIDHAGDVDFYSFTVGRSGLWTIETRGASDTECQLFDRDGAPLAEDDDSGEETNCRILHELEAGLRYFVAIRMADPDGVGGYELWLIAPDAPVVSPRIRLEREEGPPGTLFRAAAIGLTPGGEATFHLRQPNLEESDVATGNADDQGRLGAEVTTFENSPVGTYLLWVQDLETELASPPVTFRLVAAVPEDDHGDEMNDASTLSEGEVLDGEIEDERDVDWFRFRTGALGRHRVETLGDTDTICTLYDAQGVELAANDDSGAGLNCRIDQELEFQSSYFLRITTFMGRTGSYQVSLRGPIDDHSNQIDGATPLADRALRGLIERPGDLDFFAVNVLAAGSYRIRTTGETDTYCTLLRAGGEEIASNDDGGENSNCELNQNLDGPGTYYLRVNHFSRLQVGAYGVELTAAVVPPADDDYGNTPETAGLIRAGVEVGAVLEAQGDIDHFLFFPGQTGTWRVETLGNLDTTCVLLTEDGERLASNDDNAGDANCQIDFSLVAGRGYIFAVRGFADREQGMYTVRTTYIPEE